MYEDIIQVAIFHTKLLTSDWDPEVILFGLNLNAVWEGVVKMVGTIEAEECNILEEQIHYGKAHDILTQQIELLEANISSEKQPRRKLEMFEERQVLKGKLK